MDEITEAAEPVAADKMYLTVRQAAFIGVGAMMGGGALSIQVGPEVIGELR